MMESPIVDASDVGPPISAMYEEEEDGDDGGVRKKPEAVGGREVAMSEALSAATSEDQVSLYQLKWVEWRGGYMPIVTQNENGPCPLLAICNILLLTSRIKIEPGETVISSSNLMHLLGQCLIDSEPEDLTEGERANYEQNIQDAMSVFPKLQTGLDVNVKFNSVSGFEFTSESGIFDLLSIGLYHGWLADPQDQPTWDAVCGCSYNQLVEKVITDGQSSDPQKAHQALLGQQFLESTASQLTYHGLCELNSTIREGELCVFFRNNHFSTLLKRNEHLLLLVTDHGFVNEVDHVWHVLDDIDGDGDFLDGKFKWSSHSDTQRRRAEDHSRTREEGEGQVGGGGVSKTGAEATEGVTKAEEGAVKDEAPPIGLDYQLALQLQQEEELGGKETGRRQKKTTPTHQQQSPPNTKEEYEREASLYEQRRAASEPPSCSLL